MTSDVLLQLTQNLLNDRKERPKLLAVARRMIPDILRAAEAMCHLRGYVTGNGRLPSANKPEETEEKKRIIEQNDQYSLVKRDKVCFFLENPKIY